MKMMQQYKKMLGTTPKIAMPTNNEIYIKENTKTSHKHWESMVMYALHYALRDVLIESQYSVGTYLIDAYMPDLKLAIEIDEKHHKNNVDEDKRREDYIVQKLGCRFIRIDVQESIYEQVDRVINEVISLNPPKWIYSPPATESGRYTGMFSALKHEGLSKSGTYEFVASLRKKFDELEFKTSDCTIPGHIPEANGYLGFMVNMDGIEFSIVVTKSNKPKVLVTRFRTRNT